ncbi:Uncharacterised protein [uncultured archaeon]|nr:Uncharacterised protein [uncultured archaeon]
MATKTETEAPKKSRNQLNKALNIEIQPSRCRSAIKKFFLPERSAELEQLHQSILELKGKEHKDERAKKMKEYREKESAPMKKLEEEKKTLNKQIKDLKKRLDEFKVQDDKTKKLVIPKADPALTKYNACKDEIAPLLAPLIARRAQISNELSALKKNHIRLSESFSVAIAVLAETVIREFITNYITRDLNGTKHDELSQKDLREISKDLITYPLMNFNDPSEDDEAETDDDKNDEDDDEESETDDDKKDEEKKSKDSTSFKTYINNIRKNISANLPASDKKNSKLYKIVYFSCDSIILNLLRTFSETVKYNVLHGIDSRHTIDNNTVIRGVATILKFNGKSDEEIDSVCSRINSVMTDFKNRNAEKQKNKKSEKKSKVAVVEEKKPEVKAEKKADKKKN